MEEQTKKRKVSAESLNLCTKEASPIDFDGVSLDDDALTEILVRLPPKFVTRSKTVCKSWLSLISSEHFHRLYTAPFKCRPISLILTVFKLGPRCPEQIIKTVELFYDSNHMIQLRNEKQRRVPSDICRDDFVSVLSCSWNGLMLINNIFGDFHVYNPTTNQSQKIFLPHKYNKSVETLYLLFDPSKSLHYKIVYIQDEGRINVFDSESRTWSVCVEGFTGGKGKNIFYYLIHEGLLYIFNIVKDVSQFTVCPLPKLADQGIVNGKILHESNDGCVYYFAFVNERSFKSTTGAALWELQVDGDDPRRSKWLLKYHCRIRRLPDLFVDMLGFVTETSTVLFHVGKCEMIMAYSFPDKTYKALPLGQLEPFRHYYVHVGETLPSF